MKKVIVMSLVLMLITFLLVKLNKQRMHQNYSERLTALNDEIINFKKVNKGLPKNARDIFGKYTSEGSSWWCDKNRLPRLKGLGHCEYKLSGNGNDYTLRVGDYDYWVVYESKKSETFVDDVQDFVVGVQLQKILPLIVFMVSFALGAFMLKRGKKR